MVSNFQTGLGGFFSNINAIFEQSLYVNSVFELMELEPKVKMPEHPIPLKIKAAPKIEFKNVSFKYPDTKNYILKNFSLSIESGEKVAFVGENGAGKSTMIKLLARFYDVDEGEILINGINIKDVDLSEWYKYEASAKENINFGNIDLDDTQKIIDASVSAGSHQMIQKFENQYEQMLGRLFDQGIEPSGGQWQKIALARAFFRNAPVLVLDEPTASIDAKAESEIFNRVERLSKDKTVIIISHRFSTVRNADKIYVIDGGKIIESGEHHQLMKLDGHYAELFNLQAKGYR
jgi:ATP-binding cassette subfamily B protein